jgi:FdhD protein
MGGRKIMDNIEKFSVIKVTGKRKSKIEDIVVTEAQLTIVVNNQKLITLPCSPNDLEFLAIGFLFSKGILKGKEEITKVDLDDSKCIVWVETEKDNHLKPLSLSAVYNAANSKVQSIVESHISVASRDIVSLVEEFQHRSEIFISTGGVHSVALCEKKDILVFKEDISRNNALDKLFGECILKDIPTEERMVVTSCRISSEILRKVAKRNIPILISKSAPTNLAVRLAAEMGITLIGFVRAKRMNVYANDWRVI